MFHLLLPEHKPKVVTLRLHFVPINLNCHEKNYPFPQFNCLFIHS